MRNCTRSTLFLNVFSVGIKELSTALADNSWLKANPEESFINSDWMLSLSIPHYIIKKGRCHDARHGKTEEQKEYHVAWNAWKRCCKKVGSQGEHFTDIHDRCLRDQVYRESQLVIGWTEQKCIEMDELTKQNHTYNLSTEEFKKIPRTVVSHLGQVRQKRAYATSTRFSQSLSKTVFIVSQVRKLQNQFLQHNMGDGTLP